MITRNNFLLISLASLSLFTATPASAQEWQSYQLTNFPPPATVTQCSSVADTFGHVHHFFVVDFGPLGQQYPLYYMRSDFYGNILTDTIKINGFAPPFHAHPQNVKALGDGAHVWCVFSEITPGGQEFGGYLTERNSDGSEVFPPRLLGMPLATLPLGYNAGAALRYDFRDWLKFDAGYSYAKRISNFSDLDYVNKTIFFRLTATL